MAEQLRAVGIPTLVPALPNPIKPNPRQWEDSVAEALGTPDEHTIVVAHSLGSLTVLRALRAFSGDWRVGTLVLVAGFVDRLPALPDLDSYIGDRCELTALRDHIDRLVMIRSDNDPFVPPDLTDRLAGLLGVSARVVPGGGHFLASEGFTSLPEAYEALVL